MLLSFILHGRHGVPAVSGSVLPFCPQQGALLSSFACDIAIAGGAAAPPAHKTAPAAALQRSAAHPPTPKTLPAQQQPAIPVSAPPKPAAEPAAPPSAPKTASTIAAPGQTLKAPKDVQQAAPKPTPPAGSTSSAAEPAPTQVCL